MTGATTQRASNMDFNRLDYNRNGRIERNEWYWSRASFDERDLNNDGVLTRREFNTVSDATLARDNVTDIRVDSRERWTNTGIYVRTGDTVRLNATGTIVLKASLKRDPVRSAP